MHNRRFTDDEIITALREHGSERAAAKALGMGKSSIHERIQRLSRKGWSPKHGWTHTVPDGFQVKGVSTLYGRNGEQVGQWVKSTRDLERQREMLEQAIAQLGEPIRGLFDPIPAPAVSSERSLSAYLIGDAHFGMYAWDEETGENFDTSIAAKDLRAAIDLLVAGAPASDTAFLVDVGDFLHADNRSNATPASGNQLDVDTRYQRVIRVAIEALRYAVGRLLQKHQRVKVFITPGNHNPDSAGWMAMVLEAYFEREPRVVVERSPSKFFYERFGSTLIGITHGDKLKMQDLPAIMASDRAQDWGATEHRYWWTGHIHHTKHQEYRGCFVESFNTLAGSDAWHHASGYRSQRQMQRIDIDVEFGIYNRGIAHINLVRAKA